MHAVPLVLSLLAGLLVTPPALRFLEEEGRTRENFRGRYVPGPAGFAIVAAAVLALIPLSAFRELSRADVFEPELGRIAVYVIGVAFLGLVADALAGPVRGWREHGAAMLGGAFSTGSLKALGTLGLAAFALSGGGLTNPEYLLAVALLVVTTNLFALLDRRPGRIVKLLGLVGLGASLGAWTLRPLWALGLFVGATAVVGFFDIRERAVLGDTGAYLVGGVAGLWLVLALGTLAQVIALVVVAAITVYAELGSIEASIERTPVLRQLDTIGRPSA